ncbi:MAG TPA: type II secretion system secretin GspD [Myxococcota bacterium]|nr:type II secretion system secretin GspD [Myxococcota bacterium]
MPKHPSHLLPLTLLALLAGAGSAFAQEGGAPPAGEATPTPPAEATNPAKAPETVPPQLGGARGGVSINYVDADLMSLVEYFARVTGRNFILGDTRELQGKKVTIISNTNVSPEAAYEAFLSALEVHGLTTVQVGDVYKIIKANEAQQSPGVIKEGGDIRATDNYVTQIITLQNVLVTDVRTIIDNLISPNAKVLAYAPTNSLILTDSGNNIRRIYKLVTELDVAAPKSTMEIYTVVYAEAEEVKQLIEELYGTAEDSSQSSSSSTRGRTAARTPANRARRDEPAVQGPQEGVTAGKESRYITKVLSDDRTNSLIVLANEQGHQAVTDLIKRIDIDVDPASRSAIYVYRLEHAKAEDVSKVLQDLAQEKGKAGGKTDLTNPNARVSAARARETEPGGDSSSGSSGSGEPQGAAAAFDSGMRIAADENTNSLVIIASKDDYAVIKSVIQELDVKRKQVYLDCVIVELSSQDRTQFDIAYHTPFSAGGESQGLVAGQFGTNSLGLSTDALSGFSFGVFGKSVDIPITSPLDGSATTLSVPAFGIALQALKSNQMVNIVSAPSLLAMDNEKAKIVVGRKIPFPTSNGLNSLGQPVISFQREDVAITMEVTPRVNSENYVTLELKVEVQEIEDSSSGGNVVQQGGYITSNREVETTALVADNQTMVLGGLVGSTDSESESKIPILGDIPVLGALFRSRTKTIRRTNLMVFLTPHIIDDEEDMMEVMRVKEAQRQEFMRRFYGKSEDEQMVELQRLLQFSMNRVDRPSVFRGPAAIASTVTLDGQPISAEARQDVEAELEGARSQVPGEGAGEVPRGEVEVQTTPTEPAPESGEGD